MPEERIHFEVHSARNAELFRSDRPWAAIQISSRGDYPVLSEENRVEALRLVFEDTLEPNRLDSFTGAQARQILDFVGRMRGRVDALLIHCEVGLSRSPAVAAALSRIYEGDDGRWFEMYFPNDLVYQRILEAAAETASAADEPR